MGDEPAHTAHLGVETQRQWSDKAISRTTPALLGLYSLVTLWAEELLRQGAMPYAAAWYRKSAFTFTFTDAIAPSGVASGSETFATHPRLTGKCPKSLRTASSAWQMLSASRPNAQSQA